jgi:hypothetical protein
LIVELSGWFSGTHCISVMDGATGDVSLLFLLHYYHHM